MDVRSYLDYKDSLEDYAVAFVKKHLANADDYWIDILYAYAPEHEGYDMRSLEFERVICSLFPKKLYPPVLSKWDFESKDDYAVASKAITWETARKDIELQREAGETGKEYRIIGIRELAGQAGYKLNDGLSEPLRNDLAELINGSRARTDSLWDVALNCMSYSDGYTYRIKAIEEARDGDR